MIGQHQLQTWSAGDLPQTLIDRAAALFVGHPYRDFQHRALRIDKEVVVRRLVDDLDHHLAVTVTWASDGGLWGLCQAVPAPRQSRALGRRMWNIRHLVARKDAPPAHLSRMIAQLMDVLAVQANGIGVRVACDDIDAQEALEDNGFRNRGVELVVQVRADALGPEHVQAAVDIHPATTAELPALSRIAGSAHAHNAFAYDPVLSGADVARLYAALPEAQLADPTTGLLVANDGAGRVAGFISYRLVSGLCLDPDERLGSLDFIALRPEMHGRAIGDALNRAALQRLNEAGARRVTVRTMASNYKALGVLRKIDMRVIASNVVLRRWMARSRMQVGRFPRPPALEVWA